MSRPLVYVDTSEVRNGALEELRAAIRELAEFVDENEPQLISYDAYLSEDGTQMTVIHVHADPASLDYHMDVAGPRFGRFADLVRLRSIHMYGEPSEKAVGQLCDKVRLLGNGEVTVHAPHAGFGRFALPERPAPAKGLTPNRSAAHRRAPQACLPRKAGPRVAGPMCRNASRLSRNSARPGSPRTTP
jgi:quinol monooxygenase YgiN